MLEKKQLSKIETHKAMGVFKINEPMVRNTKRDERMAPYPLA